MVFRGLLHWRETRPGERPRGRGPERRPRLGAANARTHFNLETGFSIIEFIIKSDLAANRLGDIAQLVDPYNNGVVSACLACGRS